MMVAGVKPLTGVHSESTACRNLLASEGVVLSEPIVFGLGSGIGFMYLENSDRKTGIREPFVVGRVQPDGIIKNISESLRIRVIIEQTVNRKEAWNNLVRRLDGGKPYGLKLNLHHLDYANGVVRCADHYVTAYGYDANSLYVVDVSDDSVRKTSLLSVEKARSVRSRTLSRNLGFYFDVDREVDIKESMIVALRRTACDMLQTKTGCVGVRGIKKFSEKIKFWMNHPNFKYLLLNHYFLWEKYETGGAGFRRMYSDFLHEAGIIMSNIKLRDAGDLLEDVASKWVIINEEIRVIAEEEIVTLNMFSGLSKRIRDQAGFEERVFRLILDGITY